jgi:hypothetical protein
MTENELDRSCYTPIIVAEGQERKEEDDDWRFI